MTSRMLLITSANIRTQLGSFYFCLTGNEFPVQAMYSCAAQKKCLNEIMKYMLTAETPL